MQIVRFRHKWFASSLLVLDVSTLPKYVVLKSEFSLNLVVLNISYWIPSYTSKYSCINFHDVSPKSDSNICFSFFLYLIFIYISLYSQL